MKANKATQIGGEPIHWNWYLADDEVEEIFNTMSEALKWGHANNEKKTRSLLQDLIDAGYKEPYKH
jgi:hypothetical protein